MTRPLNLSEFECKLRTRRLRKSDFERVVARQLACFPRMKPWTKEQFDSHLVEKDSRPIPA